ncbi:nitroreductase family protein [Clostridium isatidis]|uniref:Nitroreductase n=1 Tax=Clostridium isatidis TaxID=182773 RepID=A0A343JF72_9CLOT|nr:nitroreductase family protein [Clostridium isatidis]ASW44180.1 nitroreductase [Clostridium isatidis]
MFKDLVKKSRSYRRFYGDKKITKDQLKELVELVRYTPSAANLQPLKYILVCEEEINKKVYETLSWAGYLREWDGPIESERPTAYVIMLRDKTLTKKQSADEGICAQTICLGAAEVGLGGCILGSINRAKLTENLNISDDFEIALVIALGYPKENVIIEDMDEGGSIKYYRDEEGNHYVPKRSLEELIVKEI